MKPFLPALFLYLFAFLGGAAQASVLDTTLFPVDDRMIPAIGFWKKVFTQYDSEKTLLHDREHLDCIWEVVEHLRSPDGEVDSAATKELIESKKTALAERFQRLARDPAPLDNRDREIMAIAHRQPNGFLLKAGQRIRGQRGIADRFEKGLKTAVRLLPTIEPILMKRGVPKELAALPLIESTYNTKARSSSGAAGIWQLMPATAKQYGVKVSRKKDERYQIKKATEGASKILAHNFRLLKSWPLAITGYNHGPYGMMRAVKKVGSRKLIDIIDRYQKRTWGFASKNFYIEFIAAVEILNEYKKTGRLPNSM